MREIDREFFKSRFGADFGGVRVHTGDAAAEAARELNADAFTVGSNIVFGPGRYAPASAEGRRLLAHELTHVVQQSGAMNAAGIAATGGPMIQRQTAKEEKPDAGVEGLIRKAAARAQSKPEDRTVMFLSASEMVYRLVHSRMPRYDGFLSGVGYSEDEPGLKVGDDGNITVGQWFVLAKNDPDFHLRAGMLENGLNSVTGAAAGKPAPKADAGKAAPQGEAGQNATAGPNPVAQPAAPGAKADDKDAANKPQSPRDRVIKEILPGVMGAKHQPLTDSTDPDKPGRITDPKYGARSKEDKDKWQKLGGGDVAETRKSDPKYTTCGVLPRYVLEQLGLKDSWLTSSGLFGVAFGKQVMQDQPGYKKKDPADPKEKAPQVPVRAKDKTEEEVKKLYGPTAWSDKDGNIFRGGARSMNSDKLKVWVENGKGKHPNPGDIYVLVGPGGMQIKHIGVFVGWSPNADGTETWETADAGQGVGVEQKAVYSKKGRDEKKGEQKERTYNPEDKTVTGVVDKGEVLGWVDLEAALQYQAAGGAITPRPAPKKPQK